MKTKRIFPFLIITVIFLNLSCNSDIKENNKVVELTAKENELAIREKAIKIKEDSLLQASFKPASLNESTKPKLDALKKYNGQYPFDVNLINNKLLKTRLKKMLGDKYDFIKETWSVTAPIEIVNNELYVWGMQAHSGGDPSAVLMINFDTNVIYVGIRNENQIEISSEDGSPAPKKLLDWKKSQLNTEEN